MQAASICSTGIVPAVTASSWSISAPPQLLQHKEKNPVGLRVGVGVGSIQLAKGTLRVGCLCWEALHFRNPTQTSSSAPGRLRFTLGTPLLAKPLLRSRLSQGFTSSRTNMANKGEDDKSQQEQDRRLSRRKWYHTDSKATLGTLWQLHVAVALLPSWPMRIVVLIWIWIAKSVTQWEKVTSLSCQICSRGRPPSYSQVL